MSSDKTKLSEISLEVLRITASLVPIIGNTLSIYMTITKITKDIQGRQVELIKELIDEIAKKEAEKSKSIVEIMMNDKEKKGQRAYIVLAITFLAQITLSYFTKTEIISWFTVLIGVLAVAIYLNQTILGYRIKKGLYGTNDYEAREIIEFIFANAEFIDFGDGNNARKIYPEPEKETQENIIPEGGVIA